MEYWRPKDWNNPYEKFKDWQNFTAQHKAYEAGADEIIRALLKRGLLKERVSL